MLREQRIDHSYAPGVTHDGSLEPIRKRLESAQVFVLDQDAVAMAANVSLSKPSSMVMALPWVKLPFEQMWLEFSTEQLAKAMADLGSPMLVPQNMVGRLTRAGFLLRIVKDRLEVEYIHAMSTHMGEIVELSSVKGIFDISDIGEIQPSELLRPASVLGTDKVKQHLKLITTDPHEAGAYDELRSRFDWDYHPDLQPAARAIARNEGDMKVAMLHANWLGEFNRLFFLAVLPALILINAKNAVSVEPGPSLEKLNKQRLKKGKIPLAEHQIIKLKLTASQKRASAESSEARMAIRGSLVIGHFKVRDGRSGKGIFWWSMHTRNGYSGSLNRVYLVTG